MRLALFIALVAGAVGALAFASPLAVLAGAACVVGAGVTVRRPLATLAFLALYLPFEPLVLKFAPDDVYLYARVFSESLAYLLAAVAFWRSYAARRWPSTPADLPFVLFAVVLVASALVNAVEPSVAALGARQILRFVLVFFAVVHLRPERAYVRGLTAALLVVAGGEALLGLAQPFVGEPLDAFLLPSEARTFGEITLTGGVAQFWDPGSRVFATLGRYDRLGNFLYFFLLIAVGLFYGSRGRERGFARDDLKMFFLLAVPALVLTYSRASWFAFLVGFLFVAVWVYRSRRVAAACVSVAILAVSYLAVSGLNVRFITEVPGQTLVERFYETFSATRWRGEYYGLGRVYWMVQTPLAVVSAAPLFGVGPGQFGGGAAAALGNARAYEQLGLPFGVYGTEGIIDNNWFSLWGETGTLGLAFFLWAYVAIFRECLRVSKQGADPFDRALAVGTAAAMIGVALNAFLSTSFEIRTLAFYLWMYAGFVVVLGGNSTLGAQGRRASGS